jgi:dipeptidyl-peptidase 4
MRRILVAIVCLPLGVWAQQKKEFTDIKDAVFSSSPVQTTGAPRSVNWISGGDKFSYINETQQIQLLNSVSLSERPLLGSKKLFFPGTQTDFTYDSFQWAKDGEHLVFKSNPRQIFRRSTVADFYMYGLTSESLSLVAKEARSAELSPDGTKVGIVRNGNLFGYDIASAKEVQYTHDAKDNVFNGYYDWVYEEEFGKAQAWNWSPDSKYIAYWQFDEHKVPDFQMSNFSGLHPEWEHISIPDPGDDNPAVRIGVIDVHTMKNVWLQPDETGDFYIPRIYWTSEPDVIAMITLNRAQNHLKLYFFNLKTGTHRVVMEEKNNTWVAIFNFYTNVDDMMYFPTGSKEFFWISDRSGYYHIYRYGYDGKLMGQVTSGNWDVIKMRGIDPAAKTLYYLSAEASPLEQQLYSIHFDGTGKQRLTQTAGYHDIDMSPNTKYYLDTWSDLHTPPQSALFDLSGKQLKVFSDGSLAKQFISTHAYAPTELFHFTTSDGVGLDGSIIKPLHFDSTKKYPVVMAVYGGPESHDVFNQFSYDPTLQWLAQNGYIIVDVNNRGVANYGSAFMKIVYKQLGKWESNDFAETAHYLSSLPYVDTTRMAIMGGSYGGYSTIFTMLTHPGIFKVGMSNSGVTDWRLYDDIYTERYMGPLHDNEAGYLESAATTHAANLKGHLLLIHSMRDDNVHVAQTMQLLTALTDAGKDADLRIYPPGEHGAFYSLESFLLAENVQFQYLERYLKGNCELPPLN